MSRINGRGVYKCDGTNAFLIRDGRRWHLYAGEDFESAIYHGWVDTFDSLKDARVWLMFNEKMTTRKGIRYNYRSYITCDICGDCHDIDSIPMGCQTGDGE